MGRVGRVALFGIPLLQWALYHRHVAPTHYLQTDAPLYYYSFTDVHRDGLLVADAEQEGIGPRITGFNATDMYAGDNIRRVLTTFPGVFSGIGEVTIHKEFVSSKIAGETASLLNPALDRILDFAAEVGLVVILHNDIDMPFPRPGQEPYQVAQLKDLFSRHQRTTIVWAHAGVGRVVAPLKDRISTAYENPIGVSQIGVVERTLSNPERPTCTRSVLGRNRHISSPRRNAAGDRRSDQPPSRPVLLAPTRSRRPNRRPI